MEYAKEFIPTSDTIVISIRSPGGEPVTIHQDVHDILRLYFADSVPKLNRTGLFSAVHAKEIITFLNKYHEIEKPFHLLVHCEAGISRSAAVAVFAASHCDLSIRGKLAFLNPHVLTTLVKETCPMYAFD